MKISKLQFYTNFKAETPLALGAVVKLWGWTCEYDSQDLIPSHEEIHEPLQLLLKQSQPQLFCLRFVQSDPFLIWSPSSAPLCCFFPPGN